ncbi:hypothetical protein [Cellulomonas sp. URHB0016]
MTGRGLGLLSLRMDALYCAVLGAVLVVAARSVAPVVSLPAPVVGAVGGAVVIWGAAVAWMAASVSLRAALRVVTVANLVAAAGITAFSITAAGVLVLLSVLAIALDVAAFGASQALALNRLGTDAAG